MILAKNSQYAKMRENSRTLAKIEWPPVQSLLVLGFPDTSIVKKMTVSLKSPKKAQNGQFWKFLVIFLGVKQIF